MREKEDMKRRVKELEKECFQLTYYQQEFQRGRVGTSDPVSRENQELKTRTEQLCLSVQQFMLSMRRLQRAVNNKDKDIQDLKADFEKNKKLLEQMVKDIKEKDEQSKRNGMSSHTLSNNHQNHNLSLASANPMTNHSMIIGSTSNVERNSYQRFSSNDGRVVADPRRGQEAVSHLESTPQSQMIESNSRLSQHSVTQRQANEAPKVPLANNNTMYEAQITQLKEALIRAEEQLRKAEEQSRNAEEHARKAEERATKVESVLKRQVVELIA